MNRRTIQFERCRQRLERVVTEACASEEEWPSRVGAAVRAALELAASDPDAGLTLTEPAARRGADAREEFTLMVDHFAALLGAGAPARNLRLPDAVTVIERIARQVNLELEAGRGDELVGIAADLTFLALMPYLGFAGARQWSQPTATA